jgi:drug/metabolite transporter (DMT)-like permease
VARSADRLDALVFLALTLVWGTTWAAIRIALAGIPPLTGVAVRFALAGALLCALAWRRGVALGRSARERRLWLLTAGTTFAGSYGLVYWAEQWVPSGLAALLFATYPIWVALGARWTGLESGGGLTRVAGLLLGFAGVAVLFSEDLDRLAGAGVRRAAAILLLAPILSAVGSIAVKLWGKGISAISLGAVPMLLTGVAMAVVAASLERDRPLSLDWAPWAATLYLALFGSALTFTLYFWLLARRSVVGVGLIAYTVPMVAVLVGHLALDEPFTPRLAMGALLVLGGVGLALRTRRTAAPSDLGAARTP